MLTLSALNSGKQQGRRRSRRPSSASNHDASGQHAVVFADEITDDDQKFSPAGNGDDAPHEGILHNREEAPLVQAASAADLNTFEATQPLDDLMLVRRKSLQMSTPTGSQSNSQRGSRLAGRFLLKMFSFVTGKINFLLYVLQDRLEQGWARRWRGRGGEAAAAATTTATTTTSSCAQV